nr:hypothetical protein [uncultured Prevotella sp.]
MTEEELKNMKAGIEILDRIKDIKSWIKQARELSRKIKKGDAEFCGSFYITDKKHIPYPLAFGYQEALKDDFIKLVTHSIANARNELRRKQRQFKNL